MKSKFLKPFIFKSIQFCIIITVAVALMWSNTLADTIETESQASESTSNTESQSSESSEQEETVSLQEDSSQSQPDESDEETTQSQEDEVSTLEQEQEENQNQSTDIETNTQEVLSEDSIDDISSSTDTTSDGFFEGILNTAKDIIETVKDAVTNTVDTVSEFIHASSTPENALPDIEELLDMTIEEIDLLATSTVIFIEEETESGKLVTVTAPNEDPDFPIINVLASTTIPEIYKLGEEDKIQIKWKNNSDQEMSFDTYDTDNNGYIDYVEWTIPHLSTQVFEIIFISKAFQLDENKNIIADIFDQVESQDGVYASLINGQYIRATFEEILDNTKDITLYARATNTEEPVSLEVFPLYDDGNGNLIEGSSIAMFDSITEEGTYQVFLNNLNTPTDTFDIFVSGNIEVDLVIDPIEVPVFIAEQNGQIDQASTYGSAETPGVQGVDYPGPGDTVDLAGFTLTSGASPIVIDSLIDSVGGGSLELSADLTVTNQIVGIPLAVTGTSTITADIQNDSTETSISVTEDGNLTYIGTMDIIDTLDVGSFYGIVNYGSITDVSGTLNLDVSGGVAINNYGIITDISGTINNNLGYQAIYNNDGATINDVSGGVYVTSQYGIYNEGVINNLTGTFQNNGSNDAAAVYNSAGSILEISGTISNMSSGYGIYVYSGTIQEISGRIDNVDGVGILVDTGTTIESISETAVFTNNTGISIRGGGGSVGPILGTGVDLDSYNGIIQTGEWNLDTLYSTFFNTVEIGHNLNTVNQIVNVPLTIIGTGVTISADIFNDTTTIILINPGASLTYFGNMTNSGGTGIHVIGTLQNVVGVISNSGLFANAIINQTGGVIANMSGTIINSAEYNFDTFYYGSAIDNSGGTINDISGTIQNTNTGYGIYNYNGGSITDISGTIENTGLGSGINNDGGTISNISGLYTNTQAAYGLYNNGLISNISGLLVNSAADGSGIYNASQIDDISGSIINYAGFAVYNDGTFSNLSGTIYNFLSGTYYNLDNTGISGSIINMPVANGYIWTNSIGDSDWDTTGNWLEGIVPNKTTDNIILSAHLTLPSNISNPIYFAPGGYTLYGEGLYTVDNSIYGIAGTDEIGINAGTDGASISLNNVDFTGQIYGGGGGGGSLYGGSGDITIDTTDLDLSDTVINLLSSGSGSPNGTLTLNYDSLTTNTSTYLYEVGELIINAVNYYDTSGDSVVCADGVLAGTPGCAWNGIFNPLIFYFNNAVNTDWNELGNWWNDADFTVPASTLPTSIDQVIIYGEITTATDAEANTIVFNGTSTNSANISVSTNATFNASSTNTGTITITNGTSTFYGDGTDTTLGSIIGGFLQRIFETNATTSRDFTTEGGRADWFIKAIGTIVVDVFDATYNLASNVFQAIGGALFQSERGGDSNPAGQPTPIITFDLGGENVGGDIIKWDPVIDWDTATTTGCIYSYDNFETTDTLDCSLGGADLPRPSAGTHELSLRGIDENGNIAETEEYEFTYNNTDPVWTMCGDDLLDENRSYYYLTEDVTGPCTITASQATTILKGNLVSTSTGYTVTGNIVGNGRHINLQNITITGTVDSNGGNIITSSATIDSEIISNGGDITISSSISATSTSQGGDIVVTSATTTALVSTATTTGATAGSVTINSSVVGSITANGVSGTNGGNGGNITIATSTTGILYANGANGTTNGGNGGNITITNSYATPVGAGIYSNGGNSTSCGDGGDSGLVALIISTYGTITANGGTGEDSGCPGSGGSSGQSQTPSVQGSYTPPSSGNSGGEGEGSSENSSSGGSSSALLRNLIRNTLNPLNLTPITPFTPFSPNFNPTIIGQTNIPNPFQNFQAPGIINLINLPVNFLTNISKFLFAPLPQTLTEALSSSPLLAAYIGSVGISNEQNIATLAANPAALIEPLSDESTPPGLFIVRSGTQTITSYATYDQGAGGLAQLIKVSPNQLLSLSLIPQSTGEVIATYLGQQIRFTQGTLFATAQIETPPQGGRYILKTPSSPIPLLIEVMEPVKIEEPKKQNIFIRIWNWIFNR